MTVNSRTITILILENNTIVVRLIREYLHAEAPEQFEITFTRKLKTGLNRLRKEKPDIVLLDINLPDCQGLAVFSQVHAQVPEIPIVVLTGPGDSQQAKKAVRAGAQDYLVKGDLNGILLMRTILSAIERKQVQEAARTSEMRFRGIFENTTIGMYRTTPDGRIVLANPTLIQMLGYDTFEQLTQRNLEKSGFEPGYPRSEFRDLIEKEGVVHGLEAAWNKKDGSTIYIRESAKAMRDEAGNIEYYDGTVENITERKRAEAHLTDTLNYVQTIIETSSIGIITYKASGETVSANAAIAKIVGATLEQILAQNFRDLKSWKESGMLDAADAALSSGHEQELETNVISTFNKNLWLSCRFAPFQYEGELRLLGIFSDVTERKLAEESLRESQSFTQNLIETTPNVIAIYDLIERKNVYANREITNVLGYSPKDIQALGSTFIEKLMHPEDLNVLSEHDQWLASAKDHQVFDSEYRMKHKDGEWRWLSVRSKIFSRAEDGTPTQMFSTVQDSTERKLAENALRASEEQYRELFESIPIGVGVSDRNGMLLAFNDAMLAPGGYTREDIDKIGSVAKLYAQPEQRIQSLELLQKQGYLIKHEVKFKRKDGTNYDALISLIPIHFQEQDCIQAVVEDITERKQAEEQLIESEKKYRSLFEDIPIGVYRSTLEGRLLAANQALVQILGYESVDELMLNEIYTSYVDPETRERLVKETLDHGEIINVETLLIRKDGQQIIVLDNSHAIYDEQGEFLYFEGTITDITAWKEAERQVIESEEKYRNLFMNIPHGVYRTAQDGRILAANPALVEIFGCDSEDELLEINVAEFYADKSERKKWVRLLDESSELQDVELSLKRKDGQRLIGLDNSRAIQDEQGNILYYEGTLTDITDRKKTEDALALQTEELQERNDELDRLYRASESLILNSTFDLDSLSQVIVDTILKEFKQSNSSLILVQDDSLELQRIAVAGSYSDQVAIKTLSLDGKGLVPEAIRRGQLINEGDVRTRKEYVPNWEAARSELIIPLLVGEKVIGVIDVQSETSNAFSPDDERLIMVFARQVAMALERTRLFEAEQRRVTRLNALQSLANQLAMLHSEKEVLDTLVTKGAALANSPTCSVILLDINAGEARLAAQTGLPDLESRDFQVLLQSPIIHKALETREPIIISDIDRDAPAAFRQWLSHPEIRAFYAFPILNEEMVTGIIAFSSLHPRSLSEEEKTTYELLAKLASVTLNNARLFEHTTRNVERLASLRTVDIAIATSFDLSVTIDVLLQQVTDKLQVDAASLLLHDSEEHTLIFASNRGFRTQALRHTRLRVGEGHAGRVALERRTISIPDLKQETRELKRSPGFQDEGFVSYLGFPLIAKGQIKGVLEVFHRKVLIPDQEWLDFLGAMADQAAIAIDNAELFQNLQQSNAELSLAYDNTLEGWANALELRDEETEGHTRRVTDLTIRLARLMGVRKSNFVHIRRGALLHDIGKMGIPDSILLKPGPLTDEEWVIMRRHPEYAYRWLSRISYLRPALDIPHNHHEKWDGSGYPRGLKGEQIPLAARIFAVIDVWDALCSDRPYRKAWPDEKALAYIREQTGSHFDPAVVDAFLHQIMETGE